LKETETDLSNLHWLQLDLKLVENKSEIKVETRGFNIWEKVWRRSVEVGEVKVNGKWREKKEVWSKLILKWKSIEAFTYFRSCSLEWSKVVFCWLRYIDKVGVEY